MEQRRSPGHHQWFYESQSHHPLAETAPLVPQAAHVNDRFLLGLQQEAHALDATFSHYQPALLAARDFSQLLFPDIVCTTLTHTLTLYDRLSAALTVAQVASVQRLCNHYSARLNPLPGPDSTRESNNRLTQITQYVRLLAMQPTLITPASLQALDEVGLTTPDILVLNHLVGFVACQARVVAGIQALMAQPVRWLPGAITVADAEAKQWDQPARWQPVLAQLEPRYATPAQQAAIAHCHALPTGENATWLLGHDAATLYGWTTLCQRLSDTRQGFLAECVTARILGCRWCFTATGELKEALLTGVDHAAQQHPDGDVIALIAALTRAPERFDAAFLTPLRQQGWSTDALFGLIESVALNNWNQRLYSALGFAH